MASPADIEKSNELNRLIAQRKYGNVVLMIESGMDLNVPDSGGDLPLYFSVVSEREDIALRMIEYGASPHLKSPSNATLFSIVASKDMPQLFDKIVSIGGFDINAQDNTGTTALLKMAYQDDQNRCQDLLKLGADPNISNNNGSTPLGVFAVKGALATCELLIENGAVMHPFGNVKVSPLMRAAESEQKQAALLLLRQGADPAELTPEQYAPLKKDLVEMAEAHLKHKDEPGMWLYNGKPTTALLDACAADMFVDHIALPLLDSDKKYFYEIYDALPPIWQERHSGLRMMASEPGMAPCPPAIQKEGKQHG